MFDAILDPGIEVLVKGPRKRLCTTRLLLAHVQDKDYIVFTPNGEVDVESFDTPNATYAERTPPDRMVPLALGRLGEDFDPDRHGNMSWKC